MGRISIQQEQKHILQFVQPSVLGMIDGSVSTLAPIFATVFLTRQPFDAFLVGMATATGAAVSMALSEALSDDGKISQRGSPLIRGLITGGATLIGGSLHTLPFLVPNFHLALTSALIVVCIELVIISYVRYQFFNVHLLVSVLQVFSGGSLVVLVGWFFGGGG